MHLDFSDIFSKENIIKIYSFKLSVGTFQIKKKCSSLFLTFAYHPGMLSCEGKHCKFNSFSQKRLVFICLFFIQVTANRDLELVTQATTNTGHHHPDSPPPTLSLSHKTRGGDGHTPFSHQSGQPSSLCCSIQGAGSHLP